MRSSPHMRVTILSSFLTIVLDPWPLNPPQATHIIVSCPGAVLPAGGKWPDCLFLLTRSIFRQSRPGNILKYLSGSNNPFFTMLMEIFPQCPELPPSPLDSFLLFAFFTIQRDLYNKNLELSLPSYIRRRYLPHSTDGFSPLPLERRLLLCLYQSGNHLLLLPPSFSSRGTAW